MFLVNSCLDSLAAAPSQYLPQYVFNRGQLSSQSQNLVYTGSLQEVINLQLLQFISFKEENWQLTTVIFTVMGQTLSRSYGRCIAEFLNEESLVHLGLLDLSTCVGLRYGQPYT